MILVRQIFQAKFGMAGKLAQEMLQSMSGAREPLAGNMRVLTDLSGQFDTVVIELEFESLAAFEQRRSEMFSDPQFAEGFQRTAGMIESGRSEFFTIEG